MKTITIIWFLIINTVLLFSQNIKEIAIIELNHSDLEKKFQCYSTEFFSSAKKKVGSYYCFELKELLNEKIKHLTNQQRNNLIIIAENSNKESLVTTFFDFSDEIIKIQPLLISSKVTGSVGDTVKVRDIKGQIGKVDTYIVGEEFDIATKKRVYLQMKTISNENKLKIFRNGTIIFPQDQSYNRWITDVQRIKILLIE